MHDITSNIGGLIWFAIVIIGVVSSVVKSARKRTAQSDQGAAQRPAQAPIVRVSGVPSGLHAQFAATATPVATPMPVRPRPQVRDAAPPQSAPASAYAPLPDFTPPTTSYVPAPLDSAPPPHVMEIRNRPVRAARLFGSQHAILRSIVASEVLGKPRALREY